jgi:hypothetical protein
MAHKGKATSDVTYNPDDGPEVYSNPAVYSRLHDYTAMAREVHGPEYDPSTEHIDPDVLMRVGGGKKHGWYWIADGAITRSPLPLCLRCEQGARARVQPYDSSQHRIQQLEVSASLTRHSLSYIPSLWVIITLACNITDPARRREEGTSRDGGEDYSGARGGAGGSPGRSAEDGGDVRVHVEPWRRTGFRSATSIVPS